MVTPEKRVEIDALASQQVNEGMGLLATGSESLNRATEAGDNAAMHPTLVTLAMFPVLVTVYVRRARREEHEVRAEFAQAWDDYAARTPAFFPFVRRRAGAVGEEMGCGA